MAITSLQRIFAAGLLLVGFGAPLPGAVAADFDDTVVADLVVVAPGVGPAWWKASKGNSVVWILGLPPNTPETLRWDQSTLKRRLKGARLMLGVYLEQGGFEPGVEPPPLSSPELEKEVSTLSARLGRHLYHSATAVDAMNLRGLYYRRNRICFCVLRDIEKTVRRARVPMVTPPVYSHTWQARSLAPDNPSAMRCLRAIITEVSTPPKRFDQAAKLWAKGDVPGMLAAAPRSIEYDCEYLWPGHTERTIAFQTSLIAQALERPGKVVAVAHINQLIATNGILVRLRAQGYTIADPSKPLEE